MTQDHVGKIACHSGWKAKGSPISVPLALREAVTHFWGSLVSLVAFPVTNSMVLAVFVVFLVAFLQLVCSFVVLVLLFFGSAVCLVTTKEREAEKTKNNVNNIKNMCK